MAKPVFTEEENFITLSTGVKVQFKRMAATLSQEVFTKLLMEAKLDKKGNLVETDNPQDNLRLLKRMNDYYSTLISYGVTLIGNPEDYYNDDISPKWLRQLTRAELIDMDKYDLADQDDINFLFLRHQAFASADDLTKLSENVLNLPNA